MDEPFLGREAVRAGLLSKHQLRTRHRAIFRGVYLSDGVDLTAEIKAQAAWLFAGPDAVLAGVSAAAVHGTKWLDPNAPAVIIRPDRHGPAGLTIYSYDLALQDICLRDGMRVTSAARTGFDIGRLLPLHCAVPILDALMRATDLRPSEIAQVASRCPGIRGIRQVMATLALADADAGAESPPDSRLRMALVAAALPVPETQIEFFDEYGKAFIRVDMGWRQWKVAVEYDGVQHWQDSRQRAWDIERGAILESMGWTVIRVSAAMLRRPDAVIAWIRKRLRESGCPI
jgi:hypothetical protein